MRFYFHLVPVFSVFHAFDHFRFLGIAFFQQFSDTLRGGALDAGESLNVPGLSSRASAQVARFERHHVCPRGFTADSFLF